ncbi:hypothetical protein MPTK1_1g22510 [Marchantia polymorpha subsp. ruderalis]|uniref:Uncharacterized protein n=2 Tax=Marchantia polymorpha TaxID=3197 RepID=A0AAF6AT52_MARPO|nr:hypothetical protein MARPO_0118s0036 [Marchantia polymorpha]BBM99622.1 hypothetical protein Mp_1g22510 [Marchantia polymorpha subsp. ruderalis]|eukprot:PTQ30903.1 hypothetical protein MARPO_0118s0036 [Marchantia polymorpha]
MSFCLTIFITVTPGSCTAVAVAVLDLVISFPSLLRFLLEVVQTVASLCRRLDSERILCNILKIREAVVGALATLLALSSNLTKHYGFGRAQYLSCFICITACSVVYSSPELQSLDAWLAIDID